MRTHARARANGMAPLTFSAMTYNLWKTAGVPTAWDVRESVLRRQLARLDPDLLMVPGTSWVVRA